MDYSSAQICTICECSYRQLDHWTREGKLGGVKRPGQGRDRRYADFEAVMVRALVLMSRVVPNGQFNLAGARADVKREFGRDPTLYGWRLVVAEGSSFIARRCELSAALVVNLGTAAADVSAARSSTIGDPFPLLEEALDPGRPDVGLDDIPTVDEWLAAGAPMRDVTDVEPNPYV